jgi:hypothetical protein
MVGPVTDLLNKIITLRIPYEVGNFLTRDSRRTVLRGVGFFTLSINDLIHAFGGRSSGYITVNAITETGMGR